MSSWLPIETAPRSGRPILVFVPDYHRGEGAILTAVWLKKFAFASGWYDSGATRIKPSHWQPLPDPPV